MKKTKEVLTHNSIDNVDRIVDFSVTKFSYLKYIEKVTWTVWNQDSSYFDSKTC